MNAKTFHKVMIPVPFLFVMSAANMFTSEESLLRLPLAVAVLLFIAYGLYGATMGILFVFGRFHLGCPVCDRPSKVIAGGKNYMILECPQCGDIRTRSRWVFAFHCERLEAEKDAA